MAPWEAPRRNVSADVLNHGGRNGSAIGGETRSNDQTPDKPSTYGKVGSYVSHLSSEKEGA